MADKSRIVKGEAGVRRCMHALSAVALLLLIAPTAVVLVISLTGGFSLKFPPPSYSLRWYVELLRSEDLLSAAATSFQVALASTFACCVLGVPAAFGIWRSRSPLVRQLETLFMSPLILPALAFGLAALVFFSLLKIELSFATLAIGHAVVCTPYVVRTSLSGLSQLDPVLLECSKSLGASGLRTFWRVTLPLIGGAIGAGAFIAFMSSFDNVAVSLFLAGARNEVLPIRLWYILENNLDVRAAAVSGILIVATLVLMLIMERLVGLSKYVR